MSSHRVKISLNHKHIATIHQGPDNKPFSAFRRCFMAVFFVCPIICECLSVRQNGPVENVCAVLSEV